MANRLAIHGIATTLMRLARAALVDGDLESVHSLPERKPRVGQKMLGPDLGASLFCLRRLDTHTAGHIRQRQQHLSIG
jgi:hypothetical protein